MSNCYCVKGQYTCGNCQQKENEAAWRRLTMREREYDCFVTSRRGGCSCHLSAPCAWCVEQEDEEETVVKGGE